MVRLFIRYLKPFTLTALAIICLLFAQAGFNLLLPVHMSNIVDNGIQNSGIIDAALTVVTASKYEKLTLFLNDKEIHLIEVNYSYVEKGTKEFVDEYPILKEESIYLLNDDAVIYQVNKIWFNPLLLSSLIDNNQLDISMYEIAENSDFYEYYETNIKERFPIKKDLLQQVADKVIPTQQTVITAVKNYYIDININTTKLQNDYIYSVGIKMVFIALLTALSAILISLLTSRMAAGVAQKLRRDLFAKVESFSYAEFNEFSTASLITRTTNDITQIQGFVTMFFRIFLFSPIIGIGALINVLNSNVDMMWIIGLGMIIIVVLLIVMFIFVLPKFMKIQKLIDRVNLVARESLTGLLVVRAFGSEDYEEQRFDTANKSLAKVQLFVTRAMVLLFPTMSFLMNLLTMLVVWYGSFQVDLGHLQVGVMMAFVQYAMHVLMSFLIIAASFIVIPRASVSAVRLMAILDTSVSIVDPVAPKKFLPDHKGEVIFDKISYKYPDADEYTLSDISFVVNPKETTAIIGGTGSGKSTLINLILRMHDVTEGELLVNGVNVKDIKQSDLRTKVGYIPQQAVLFSGTIESNLRYGKQDASQSEIDKAVEIAQATEVIVEKENGYQEIISQAGTNVSGGQKQRLSIARALLRDSDIFLFDDSFSALDFKTDAALRKALKKQLADKTLIIVTQRISTIMNADQIIVIENGMIVGKGTHKELLKNCIVYQELAFSQLSDKELAYE